MRTHLCGHLDRSSVGADVRLCGWVHRRRDHGGVIFVDLRDRSGRLQIVFDPAQPKQFNVAESLRNESVLLVAGKVRLRPEGTENSDMQTGEIEILCNEIEVLNLSDPLPFQLEDDDLTESVRLRYRYLDLRREQMQRNLRFRHQVISVLRRYLEELDFVDLETPMLTRSTPEGARDYLVPSRIYPGSFFALPQSPQIFKQLLMVSGFERYYQIARCFRDEDLRADRQPEFTQLDIEASFVTEEEVMEISEGVIRRMFHRVLGVDLPKPFPRVSFKDALLRYGTDRPDLRISTELVDIADLMRHVEFKVFSEPANSDACRVAALRVPDGSLLTRQQIEKYTDYVRQFGAKGLAYIKINDVTAGQEGFQSPIVKFLPNDVVSAVVKRTQARNGDLIFFGSGPTSVVNDSLGALRLRLGHDLLQIDDGWQPLWVIDFPLFEHDQDSGRWQSAHHPFTAPRHSDIEILESNPGDVRAKAYDMVLNGTEIGGGSIRIHDTDLQEQVLVTLGIDREMAREKFGFLLEALRYGAPPHGGIAFGLDRLVSIMIGEASIREVIAFPKTQKSACLMTGAPSLLGDEQIRELGIRIRGAVSNVGKSGD